MADVSPESLQPQITLETAAKYMAQNLPGLIGGAVEILNQRVQDLRSKFSPKNAKTLLSEMLIVSMLASGCGFSNSTPEPTPVPPAPTPRVEPVPSPTVIPSPIPMPTIFSTPTPEKPPLTPTIVTPSEMILGAGVGPLTPEQTITYTQIISDIKAWGIQAQTGGVLSTTRELGGNEQTIFNLTLQTTDGRFAAWDQNKKIFVFLAAPQIGKLEWGGLAGMLVKDQQGNIISRYAFNQAKGAWELIVAPTPVPSPTVPAGPDIKLYPAPTPTKAAGELIVYDMDITGKMTPRIINGGQSKFTAGMSFEIIGEYTDKSGNIWNKFHYSDPRVADGWILKKSAVEPTPVMPPTQPHSNEPLLTLDRPGRANTQERDLIYWREDKYMGPQQLPLLSGSLMISAKVENININENSFIANFGGGKKVKIIWEGDNINDNAGCLLVRFNPSLLGTFKGATIGGDIKDGDIIFIQDMYIQNVIQQIDPVKNPIPNSVQYGAVLQK